MAVYPPPPLAEREVDHSAMLEDLGPAAEHETADGEDNSYPDSLPGLDSGGYESSDSSGNYPYPNAGPYYDSDDSSSLEGDPLADHAEGSPLPLPDNADTGFGYQEVGAAPSDDLSSTIDLVFDQLNINHLHQDVYDPYWAAQVDSAGEEVVEEDDEDEEDEYLEETNNVAAQKVHATAAGLPHRNPKPAGMTPGELPPDLGVEHDYPSNHPSYDYFGRAEDLCMMRFYDLCDSAGTDRGFMDKALKIIGDGIDVHKFNPTLAKSRRAFLQQKKKEYKMKEPTCVDVPLANVHAGYPLLVDNPNQIRRGKRDVASVVKFDFEGMVLDLLQDRGIFGNLDNLVVNGEDPFHPYVNTTGTLDEILDGRWYPETLLEMVQEGMDMEKEFFMPIVLYMDKTGVDKNQRYGLEPVLLTFAFIRRHIRRTNRANRILGFVPDLELKSSAVKAVQRNRVATNSAAAANYHACLDVLLRQITETEEKGVYTYLRLGDKVKMVRLRFKVAFVIGDGKSGDMLCLRKGSNKSAKRLSRSCDIKQSDADNPFHECNFLTQSRVHSLVTRARATHIPTDMSPKVFEQDKKDAKAELLSIASHTVVNAFDGIDFGANKAGILGATPVDPMHCFLLGIIKYVMKLALDNLSATKKMALDATVDTIFVGLRTSEKADFPRSSFAKGYTNLTLITADEWTGMLMTLLLAVRISVVAEDIMLTVFTNEEDFQVNEPKSKRSKVNANREQEEPDDTESEEDVEELEKPCSLPDFIQLAEALLCFQAWYKLGDPFPWADKAEAEEQINLSIRTMLDMLVTYLPRRTGNGWKIQKFHDLIHLSKDMAMFGSPQNFDAGPYESSLRFWAKRMSQTAQKRGYKIFAKQVGDRIFEYHCMGKARRDMGIMGDEDGLPGPKKLRVLLEGPIRFLESKPVFEIVTDPATQVVSCTWHAGDDKKRLGCVDVHPAIIRYFSDGPSDNADEHAPRYGYTRLAIGDLTYRAHPNYMNDGPWYDWSYVPFDRNLKDYPFSTSEAVGSPLDGPAVGTPLYGPEFIPVKILCFLGDGSGNGDTSMALVHCCEWGDNNFEDSVLAEVWNLEYAPPTKEEKNYRKAVIRCVHTTSLIGRFFVVEETPGVREGFSTTGLTQVSTRVLLVKPRIEWAKAFT